MNKVINNVKQTEFEHYNQQDKKLENGDTLSQSESIAFEPKTCRLCDSARNDKSKEAPKIIHKYGYHNNGDDSVVDEPERSCKHMAGETNKSESPADNIKEVK